MTLLPFISEVDPDRPAILDDAGGDWLSYGELAQLATEWRSRLEGPRGLVFLYIRNTTEHVGALLGALAAGHAVALFDPNLAQAARVALEETYLPQWVAGPESDQVTARDARQVLQGSAQMVLHPDLDILLSTSGSTGSAKLVRLTMGAMRANAAGIAEVLHISGDDVAAGYLPLHYSYGLSVLTSHLVSGARIRLTQFGLTDREFWPAMREAAVTHMPGVPFHYQIMLKLGLQRLKVPTLRAMTQAGGALDEESRRRVHSFMQETGGRFFVLYGQTEAAPRMTTLQHEDFEVAPRSCGRALPGCRIEILNPDGAGQGEVVFSGPNVMMGYAEARSDLARGDELGGRLETGDIGVLDDAGRLKLTGRVKRTGKLFGLRVNLDEVELLTNAFGATAVTQTGEELVVHLATSGRSSVDDETRTAILAALSSQFTVPITSYRVRVVDKIPRTERGKTDYSALEAAE